ncbi:MAG: hypothetical protein JW891_04220 [Candidatus Lokiarchaeota archaeon]|nr:hypothetical protein [Candidatus Lokiarchaeota archaeon]
MLNSIKSREGDLVQGSEVLKGDKMSQFAESALKLNHPGHLIKRMVYKPFIGRFFPHVDATAREDTSQLGLFYGTIQACFSPEKYCGSCETRIDGNDIFDNNRVPLALCEECHSRLYYDYFKCQESVKRKIIAVQGSKFQKELEHQGEIQNDVEKEPCEDFLRPSCGFPANGEVTNPCLKNHAIGLISMDGDHVVILVGLRDTIKYRMIQVGGLFGVILGYRQRILNLEELRRIVPQIQEALSTTFYDDDETGRNRAQITLLLDSQLRASEAWIHRAFHYWLFHAYLNYRVNREVSSFLRARITAMSRPLRTMVQKLVQRLEFDDIELIETINYFPPIDKEIKITLETALQDGFNAMESISSRKNSSSPDVLEIIRILIDKDLANLSNRANRANRADESYLEYLERFGLLNLFEVLKLEESTEVLEIQKVLWAAGSFLVVKTRFREAPVVLNMKELIGRQFY